MLTATSSVTDMSKQAALSKTLVKLLPRVPVDICLFAGAPGASHHRCLRLAALHPAAVGCRTQQNQCKLLLGLPAPRGAACNRKRRSNVCESDQQLCCVTYGTNARTNTHARTAHKLTQAAVPPTLQSCPLSTPAGGQAWASS